MANQSITFYWLPHCTTCQKALKYLEASGRKVAQFRDVKTAPLDRSEVEGLAKLAGGASELFSKRARKYRELNPSGDSLTTDRMIELMSEEYTFIKRPVLKIGSRVMAGFTPASYDRFLSDL